MCSCRTVHRMANQLASFTCQNINSKFCVPFPRHKASWVKDRQTAGELVSFNLYSQSLAVVPPLVQVCLKDLSLTSHARDKMIKLAGKRYNTATDSITIVGKKCPTRRQNKEYVLYLLKVLYLESNVRTDIMCVCGITIVWLPWGRVQGSTHAGPGVVGCNHLIVKFTTFAATFTTFKTMTAEFIENVYFCGYFSWNSTTFDIMLGGRLVLCTISQV